MLKSLYPLIDWEDVRIVGFDMDGTLYDEADFIAQAYEPIATLIADACQAQAQVVQAWLFKRWMQKGSSYNRIFKEALAAHGPEGSEVEELEARCVTTFRECVPRLSVAPRIKALLDAVKGQYETFLISDGSLALQTRKFEVMGLDKWFEPPNVGIAGRYGAEFYKPSTRILGEIDVLRQLHTPQQVVYFGDRDVDEQFAAAAGFRFVKVACMHPVFPVRNDHDARAT